MTRLCEVCDADLDALGKRPDAETCSAACRRRRTRIRQSRSASVSRGQSTRARRVRRAGVSVYLPTVDVARDAADVIGRMAATPTIVALHAALVKAVERRERREPGAGGTGASEQ